MNDERHSSPHPGGKNNEARLDELVRDLADDYHAPPRELDEHRRARLFERIRAERRASASVKAKSATPARRSPAPGRTLHTRLGIAVATAAVLLIGFGLGRWMPDGAGPTTGPLPGDVAQDAPAVGEDLRGWSPEAADALYRFAARDYLQRTETLLTEFRHAAASPGPPLIDSIPGSSNWAGGLLQETRLLLDSPASDDQRLQRLLRDLELILAEIVQLTDDGGDGRERQQIQESLKERSVLLRLQQQIPAKKPGSRDA